MEVFWSTIEFVNEFTFCIMVLIAVKGLYEDSIVLDKKVILPFLSCAVLSAGQEYIDLSGKHMKWSTVLFILEMIIGFFPYLRGDKKRIFHRIRSYVEVVMIYSFSVVCCIGSCYVIIHKTSFDEESLYSRISPIALSLQIIISIILYRELIRKGICLQYKFRERVFLLVIATSVLMLYAALEVMIDESVKTEFLGEMQIRIVLSLFLSALYIAIPFLMMKNKLSTYYEIGLRHQQEINTLELEHFKQYKEAQKETGAFRHDIINHLLVIQMLQNGEKTEEAKEYVDDLLGKIQSFSPKVVTGCEILDCILSSKLERMNQSRIDFSIDGVMDHGLDLKATDICSIFANAVDNAIEACEERENNRNIRMTIKKTASFYCISIENTFPDNRMGQNHFAFGKKHFTTKKNKELHGYGIGNIKKTVEQNNGEMTVEIKDERFVMTILLPVPMI